MAYPYRLIPSGTNIPFLTYRHYAMLCSFILTVVAIAQIYIRGLNLGIDFAGGLLLEFPVAASIQTPNLDDEIRAVIEQAGYANFSIQQQTQSQDTTRIVIRLPARDSSAYDAQPLQNTLEAALSIPIHFDRVDYVGPKIGRGFVTNAVQALLLGLVVMMLYTWIRFDRRFAIGVAIALLHDAIMVLGFFSWSRYEFDITSLGAILTVIGYSINDSIVIYDRIRENMDKSKALATTITRAGLRNLINLSINETLARTVMTASTTLLVSVILAIFAGPNLRGFSLAISFGIFIGTYSSIFISAPILADLNFSTKPDPSQDSKEL